jgi:hypothetical protein
MYLAAAGATAQSLNLLCIQPAARWQPLQRAPSRRAHGFIEQEIFMAHQQHQSCIAACNACADACDHCASACLQEQDVQMMAQCIALDMDCAAICRLAAGAMSRGSPFAREICGLCAQMCQASGDECGKHSMDHCQACAQACRACADECRRMAQA